jgi:hypothetical protein
LISFCDVVTAHVPFLWEKAEPHIRKALSKQAAVRYHENDILRLLMEEKAKLWIAWDAEKETVDAAVVTQILEHPRLRDLHIWLVGGDNLKLWVKEAIEMLEAFAKAEGCSYVTGGMRRGWLRVGTGYGETGISFEKKL